ncbi:neither inactivation nor afterpotential protein G [Anabrus simplex]|uniref:neither inactivation nor afterpotential protein G n=1 Tax=Anabrus simplex TaxID=316456 RepID=UPI0035A262E9
MHSQNSNGLLHLTQADPEDSALTQAFLEAARILRTAGEKLDFAPAQNTIHRGQRWSSIHAYLRPALGRPNLHVLLDTLVTKVLIKQNTTIGVEIQSPDGHKQSIHAYREVILSAGAINTPQILMLSGIGPWQQLEQYGIEVIADLPVGFGLHDHLNLPLYVSITSPVSVTLSKMQRLPELWQYMTHGKGYLASSAILGVGSADPDLGLVLFGLGSTHEGLLRDIANFKSSTFRGLFPFSQNTSQEGFVLLASCLQPLSRGTVSIRSVDPTQAPVIDPQYLIHPYDVTCMTKAVRLAVRVVDMAPFQILGAKLHLPHLDECRHLVPDVRNDVYVECIVRTAAITGHHPAGTCKMGSPSDPATVVDPLLRVRGIAGLRVVDASVMPTPISGHPNSVLMAMADRAASLISNS